ncbi:MAG: 3'-5' exonuclease domain-containing protein 2 [Bacteroidales bacterium]|nr:3'-5' exonuclease domain-containing protein 2 [Bacteroidales bacterium]
MPKARMFQISISPEEISALELASFPGEIVIVDEAEGPVMEKAVRYLKGQRLLGFDTETRPTFSPEQRSTGTALLQLSSGTKAFLFRLKKCGLPRPLASVLANPNILKIGAATLDDVRGLQKITKFAPKGFVDLQNIVWEYGIRDKSVKKMAAIILGVKISKAQQLSNWEAERLSDGQQRYAATDAWVCREMYLRLEQAEKNPLTYEQLHPERFQSNG